MLTNFLWGENEAKPIATILGKININYVCTSQAPSNLHPLQLFLSHRQNYSWQGIGRFRVRHRYQWIPHNAQGEHLTDKNIRNEEKQLVPFVCVLPGWLSRSLCLYLEIHISDKHQHKKRLEKMTVKTSPSLPC